MGKSARVLGMDCGVSAQVMNHALLENGLLSGEPGNYVLTEEGAKYATKEAKFSNDHSAPYYSWDESVLGKLNMNEKRKEYIDSCRDARRERNRAKSVIEGDTLFVDDINSNDDIQRDSDFIINCAVVGVIALFSIGVIVVDYFATGDPDRNLVPIH